MAKTSGGASSRRSIGALSKERHHVIGLHGKIDVRQAATTTSASPLPGAESLVFAFPFAQGLLNFICYGLNDQLKQAWLQVRIQQLSPPIVNLYLLQHPIDK